MYKTQVPTENPVGACVLGTVAITSGFYFVALLHGKDGGSVRHRRNGSGEGIFAENAHGLTNVSKYGIIILPISYISGGNQNEKSDISFTASLLCGDYFFGLRIWKCPHAFQWENRIS